VKGSVTISLDDFKKLESADKEAERATELAKQMDTALTHFVGFMSKTSDIEALAERYNRGPHYSKLVYDGKWILRQK